MSRKQTSIQSKAIAQLLTGNGDVLDLSKVDVKDPVALLAFAEANGADWLRIIPPFEPKGRAQIGRRDLTHVKPATNFFSDAYRFLKYGHKLTNFELDEHVYASVADLLYVEDGATLKRNGKWYGADVNLLRSPHFENLRLLDPINHEAEVLKAAQDAGRDLDRQETAVKKELNRAKWDESRMLKHEWGKLYGAVADIWYAHARKLMIQHYLVINEADDAKAAQMRADAIGDAIEYRTVVAPTLREAYKATKPNSNSSKVEFITDEADIDFSDVQEKIETRKNGGSAAPVKEPPVKSVVAPVISLVLNGKIANQTVDLATVKAGAWLTLFHQKRGNGLKQMPYSVQWDPSNARQVAEISGFASQNGMFFQIASEDIEAQ